MSRSPSGMASSSSAPSWQQSILQIEHRVDLQFQQVVVMHGQMNNDIRSESGQARKQLRAKNGEQHRHITSSLEEILRGLESVECVAPHVTKIDDRVEQLIVCMGDISPVNTGLRTVTELANQVHMRRWEDDQRSSRYDYEFSTLPSVYLSQSKWMESLGTIRDDWENLRTEMDSMHGSVHREVPPPPLV